MKRTFLITTVLLMILTLPLFSKNILELSDLLKPERMIIHQGYLYVTEGCTIKSFNLSDGKLLNTFGKKGEGPGEFKLPPFLAGGRDFILANSSGKTVSYTLQGKLIRETKVDGMLPKYKPVLKDFVAQSNLRKDKMIQTLIGLYDTNFKLVKELFKSAPFKNEVYTPENKGNYPLIQTQISYKTNTNKIFIADTNQGFYIKVFDNKGQFLYDIKQKFSKSEIDKKTKEKYMNLLKQTSEYSFIKTLLNFTFPKYYPAFRDFSLDNDKIYLQTYHTKDKKTEFLILDFKGKKLGSKYLPVTRLLSTQEPLYSIFKGYYYYLKENSETESWELHSEKIL